MNPDRLKKTMQLRSILYGMWLGALFGGVLVTIMQQFFFGERSCCDVGSMIRVSVGYVLPLVVVASFTLLRLLVRYNLLHFIGFTGAGFIAGGVINVFYLFASQLFHLVAPVTTTSTVYVFCSAIVVAWSIWFISMIVELVKLRASE